MDEFSMIETLFRPVTLGDRAALSLADDAALFDLPVGAQQVITCDALVAGIHFFADDPPDLIAKKALRVNLSDLAAMGAEPRGFILAAILPKDIDEAWIRRFAAGLLEDARAFAMPVLGGDTVATLGPLTITVTAFGFLPAGQALLRSTAKEGDDIWLSGTLGDAYLGLAVLQNHLSSLGAEDRAFLIDRYHLPRPRVALGQALRRLAHAAMDVSDGLAQDMRHICRASALGARIDLAAIPLSMAAQAACAADSTLLPNILGGGDDYELLFTADPANAEAILALSASCGVALTRIGKMTSDKAVRFIDRNGAEVMLAHAGYKHF